MWRQIKMLEEIKSKLIFRRETYDPVSISFMDELRKRDKTKRIYEIDPYAEVYQFRDNVYAILTDNLDGGYCSWMFLVVGPKKAFLVDTSYGLGDLKGLVDMLAGGRPVIVGNTHASFDHSYGNCRFEQAYCHEYAVPYMEERQNPYIWDYLFDGDGNGIWVKFDREDLPEWKRYEVTGVPDGYTFDLGGGHEIELIWLPGHQPGHAGFLDKKNRILFCGDDLISMRVQIADLPTDRPFADFGTVEAYHECMVRLERRLNEFDRIFPGHFCLDIDSSVVHGAVKASASVLAAPNSPDYIAKDRKGNWVRFKYMEGLGTLMYNENNIYCGQKRKQKENMK